MPNYAYRCDCGHAYEELRTMDQGHPGSCPACGTLYDCGFGQDYSASRAMPIGTREPRTFGELADLNAKKMGSSAAAAVKPAKPPLPWFRDGSVEGLPRMEKPLDADGLKDKERYVLTGEKK